MPRSWTIYQGSLFVCLRQVGARCARKRQLLPPTLGARWQLMQGFSNSLLSPRTAWARRSSIQRSVSGCRSLGACSSRRPEAVHLLLLLYMCARAILAQIEQWSDDSSPLFGVTADRTSFVGTISREQVCWPQCVDPVCSIVLAAAARLGVPGFARPVREHAVCAILQVASMKVTYAVSGFGVIVQDGAASPSGVKRAGVTALAHQHMLKGFDDADASFATWAEEVAPRTVVALDKEGRLALVAIDGVEALDLGLTLPETAEIFADKTKGFPLGGEIAHAVNMDGGGSTTFAKTLPNSTAPAQLFNRPTSTDVGDIVERNVTSIACIAASA
eukprot:INCI9878.2.p1 GENE.INCI9878.2~~INCI9878.2.p1  ORF type:complete len:331 (-),score=50.55 INCI9878.2:376-1368(-)